MTLFIARYDNGEPYEDNTTWDKPFPTYMDAWNYAVNYIAQQNFNYRTDREYAPFDDDYQSFRILKYNTDTDEEELLSQYYKQTWKHGKDILEHTLNLHEKFRDAVADGVVTPIYPMDVWNRFDASADQYIQETIDYRNFCKYTIAKYHFDMAMAASDMTALNISDDILVQIRAEYYQHKKECLKYITKETFYNLFERHIDLA